MVNSWNSSHAGSIAASWEGSGLWGGEFGGFSCIISVSLTPLHTGQCTKCVICNKNSLELGILCKCVCVCVNAKSVPFLN